MSMAWAEASTERREEEKRRTHLSVHEIEALVRCGFAHSGMAVTWVVRVLTSQRRTNERASERASEERSERGRKGEGKKSLLESWTTTHPSS
jgi:hypothetical protein